jgi:MraZ protein
VEQSGTKWDVGPTAIPGSVSERQEKMFLNQYHHSFDDKGRLTIPAKFRDLPAEGVYIVQGLDCNLMVLPPAAFQTLYDKLLTMSLTNPDARLLREIMLGNAIQVSPDASGRILLPQNLRNLADLKTEVVFVGQGDHFEIWASEHWQKQQDKINDAATNAQRFATLDLSLR